MRMCIFCEKEKESRHFWVRWGPSLGACYGCLARQFRDYEAYKIESEIKKN